MIKTYKKRTGDKITANFRASEFDCKCAGSCTETKIDPDLVKTLQKIRDHFQKPVVINSGYRCEKHNEAVNGSPGSKHMQGMAADIQVSGIAPKEVAKYAECIGVLGIGLYDNFVHIDTRTRKAFWYGHQQEYRETFGGSLVEKPVESGEKSATDALPVLRKGSENDSVYSLQVLLAGYGYLRGMYVNGKFGEETETAVKDYQRGFDLVADGVCGSRTWAILLGV